MRVALLEYPLILRHDLRDSEPANQINILGAAALQFVPTEGGTLSLTTPAEELAVTQLICASLVGLTRSSEVLPEHAFIRTEEVSSASRASFLHALASGQHRLSCSSHSQVCCIFQMTHSKVHFKCALRRWKRNNFFFFSPPPP